MIKKIFKVFIILNLIFLSSLNVNAEEREFDIENFNNEFENKNGLIKENEKLVYYEKGQKIIGFKKIDDQLYFFSSKIMLLLKDGRLHMEIYGIKMKQEKY